MLFAYPDHTHLVLHAHALPICQCVTPKRHCPRISERVHSISARRPSIPRLVRSASVSYPGRNENNSGSTWQDHEVRDDDPLGVIDVSFLRARGVYSRLGVARV